MPKYKINRDPAAKALRRAERSHVSYREAVIVRSIDRALAEPPSSPAPAHTTSAPSLGQGRIEGTLSVDCPSCGTTADSYCFPGARGFCIDRYAKGSGAIPPTLAPGELGPLALAQRHAALLREREREAAQHRPRSRTRSKGEQR